MLIMAFTMRFIINMNKLSSIVWIRTIIKLAASISVNLCYVIHLIFYLLFMIHAILHLICKKIFLKYFNADLSSECFWAVSSYLCFANAVISCSHYIMNRAEPRPLRWDVKHGITNNIHCFESLICNTILTIIASNERVSVGVKGI